MKQAVTRCDHICRREVTRHEHICRCDVTTRCEHTVYVNYVHTVDILSSVYYVCTVDLQWVYCVCTVDLQCILCVYSGPTVGMGVLHTVNVVYKSIHYWCTHSEQ